MNWRDISVVLWTPDRLEARRAPLVRASLRWWARCVGLSFAGFTSLILIERGAPAVLFAFPFIVIGAVWGYTHGWIRGAVLASIGVLTGLVMPPAAAIITLVALLFGTWTVALLALFLVWAHWWIALLLSRMQVLTDHMREQTEDVISEQGARK